MIIWLFNWNSLCIFFNIKNLISWKRKLVYKVKLFSYAPIQNAVNYRTVGNAEVKAEVLIATHTTSPHVVVLCYCWSAFWRYVSKRNCLERHFCCYGYWYSSDILDFGCDYRNIMLSKWSVYLFIYNKPHCRDEQSSVFCPVNNRNSEYGLQMLPLSHAAFITFFHPTNSYFSPPSTPVPVCRILIISLCETKRLEIAGLD